MDKQREMFEAWYSKHCEPGVGPWFVRDKDNSDEYYMSHTQTAWDAWQAAIAAQWQSIETAPEDEPFLGVLDCAGDRIICTMRYAVAKQKNSVPDSGDFHRERVTHWMPLPPEPTK